MIGRRCHCGCRARLDTCNVRSHAKYASRSCKARDWKRNGTKASTSLTQSQIRRVGSEMLRGSRTRDLSPTGREQLTQTGVPSLSSAPLTKRLSDLYFSVRWISNKIARLIDVTADQLEALVESLRAEIERIREAASIDLQNWTAKYTALMRENTTLKNQLVKQDEDEPEHDDVKDILVTWKHATGRSNRTDIGAGSKRYKLAAAGHKRWGKERCLNAVRGLGVMQYAGPRGRSAVEYPGAKRYADVEHALGDEVRMEKLEAIWLEHVRPVLTQQPLELAPEPEPEPEQEPESWSRQFVRFAYGDDCTLPYVPASKERQAKSPRRDDRPPIDRVLAALHAADCRIVCHENQPDNWSAQCPAHDDREPSLSVHRKPDGMVLLHCWAGCPTDAVIDSLRLVFADLWEDSERDFNRADGPPLPRALPAHLQQAMRDLLASSEERRAA